MNECKQNISPDEKSMFFKLIKSYSIVDSRHRNKACVEAKNKAWDKITKSFNENVDNNRQRSTVQLRKCYYNNKKLLSSYTKDTSPSPTLDTSPIEESSCVKTSSSAPKSSALNKKKRENSNEVFNANFMNISATEELEIDQAEETFYRSLSTNSNKHETLAETGNIQIETCEKESDDDHFFKDILNGDDETSDEDHNRILQINDSTIEKQNPINQNNTKPYTDSNKNIKPIETVIPELSKKDVISPKIASTVLSTPASHRDFFTAKIEAIDGLKKKNPLKRMFDEAKDTIRMQPSSMRFHRLECARLERLEVEYRARAAKADASIKELILRKLEDECNEHPRKSIKLSSLLASREVSERRGADTPVLVPPNDSIMF